VTYAPMLVDGAVKAAAHILSTLGG